MSTETIRLISNGFPVTKLGGGDYTGITLSISLCVWIVQKMSSELLNLL